MKKTVAIAMFLVLLIGGGSAFHASGASRAYSSQSIPDGVYYIFSTQCPDYVITNSWNRKAGSNNTAVWRFNGDDSQKWRVENRDGKIVLHALNYDKFVIDNEAFRPANGNNISIFYDNNTENQLWIPKKVGTDGYVLQTLQNPHYVLDLCGGGCYDGCNVQLWQYDSTTKNQIWKFVPVDMPENTYRGEIADGIYYIYPKPSDNIRLDNESNRGTAGNNVKLYESNSSNAQKWYVENRNGGIVIHSMSDRQFVLDHEDYSTYNYNNVSIFFDRGTTNQLWIPQRTGSNTYILHSAQNPDFVLDWGGEIRNEENVHLWEYIPNLVYQEWRFVRVR